MVDAVRCAIEVQSGLAERNSGLPPEKRIEFRVGIHLGDVVEESDGDLMGDGVNIAARLHHAGAGGRIGRRNLPEGRSRLAFALAHPHWLSLQKKLCGPASMIGPTSSRRARNGP